MATAEFGLSILQMMENAGRTLASHVMAHLKPSQGLVVILAGGGGNGGGGLCAARHLHNHGYAVRVLLDRTPERLIAAAAAQWRVLQHGGLSATPPTEADALLAKAAVVVDALIGYGLRSAPLGLTAALISACNAHAKRVISLHVPSGVDATTGQAPGVRVTPQEVLTLALPKTGLARVAVPIYLADIGIPPAVYAALGIPYQRPFGTAYRIRLRFAPSP